MTFLLYMYILNYFSQCPQIGLHYGIKNKAAISFQRKSNVKLIAALLFIPYSCPVLGNALLHLPDIIYGVWCIKAKLENVWQELRSI